MNASGLPRRILAQIWDIVVPPFSSSFDKKKLRQQNFKGNKLINMKNEVLNLKIVFCILKLIGHAQQFKGESRRFEPKHTMLFVASEPAILNLPNWHKIVHSDFSLDSSVLSKISDASSPERSDPQDLAKTDFASECSTSYLDEKISWQSTSNLPGEGFLL
jgi:hypothetical protein